VLNHVLIAGFFFKQYDYVHLWVPAMSSSEGVTEDLHRAVMKE